MSEKFIDAKDENGQPVRIFRANRANNFGKAIDQLSGICAGILADGRVEEKEARFFCDYVKKFAEFEPVWPFTDILSRVNQIIADGRMGQNEFQAITELMRKVIGWQYYDPSQGLVEKNKQLEESEESISQNSFSGGPDTIASTAPIDFSSALPLDEPPPQDIDFIGNEFVVTGRFAFGTRTKVMEAISQRKGIPKDGTPSRTTRYLVIGDLASRDWYNTNYGRKIERAIELRDQGQVISIISEEHWKKFL